MKYIFIINERPDRNNAIATISYGGKTVEIPLHESISMYAELQKMESHKITNAEVLEVRRLRKRQSDVYLRIAQIQAQYADKDKPPMEDHAYALECISYDGAKKKYEDYCYRKFGIMNDAAIRFACLMVGRNYDVVLKPADEGVIYELSRIVGGQRIAITPCIYYTLLEKMAMPTTILADEIDAMFNDQITMMRHKRNSQPNNNIDTHIM